jgi:type I restriction enzyme S subunit
MKTKENTTLVPKLRFPEYQQTVGWKKFFGNELFEQISDKNPEPGLPVLAITQEYGAIPRDMIDYHVSVTDKSIESYKLVKQGDFIISLRSFQGGIEYSQYHGICSPAYVILRRRNDGSDAYFKHYLKTDRFIRILTKNLEGLRDGKMISYKQFSELQIPVPAAEEQKTIADCLSSLDELIAAQGRKVEALKTHKKGLMQQLFPRESETQPRLRFSEFESLGEWSALTIQELIDKQLIVGHLDGNHGSLYPRADEFSGSGVPYISATNFNNGSIDFERCKYLPVERAVQFKKGIARNGDILFAHNATVGPVAKLTMKYDFVILSTSLTYFRCNGELLLNDFLQCALVSPAFVAQCARVMAQSTRNQIPITAQRTFGMQIPKLPEQQRIADCLNSLNELIIAAIQELGTLKTHKAGLMQQLLP